MCCASSSSTSAFAASRAAGSLDRSARPSASAQRPRVLDAARPLRDRDDAEVGAPPGAFLDGRGDRGDAVRDLGDQDDVGAAREARPEREPARSVAHQLGDDDPVMAVRGAVQPVEGVGGDLERGREADRGVGAGEVVVDGLGQHHDVEPGLRDAQGVLGRAAAAEADERGELGARGGLDDGGRHVADLAVDQHPVGLVAAGAEDRAADRQDPGQRPGVELDPAVLREPAEAVAEPDDLHAVPDRGLAEAADRGVEAGAVAAGGDDPDAAIGGHGPMLPGRRARVVGSRFGGGS